MFLGLPGLGLAGNYLLGGTAGVGSVDGLDWARDALDAWDFLTNQARFNNIAVGPLANTPGWSYARSDAQTAYAQTSAGVLTPFATGVLRRTDKGVLIEGARTNLCLQSQTFGTTWLLTNATVSSDAAVAPDGTTTADKFVESVSIGVQNRINQTITVSNATAYAFSVYVKAAGRDYLHMRISTTTDVGYKGFDLALGTVVSGGTGTGLITAFGGGWYRCTVIGTTDSTSAVCRINILPASSSNPDAYTGDGTSGLYLWGAQLEAASFPSSYIVTTTASSTRAADVLTVPVSGIDYPLSLFAEFERAVDTGTSAAVALRIRDGGGTNNARLSVNNSDLAQTYCEAAGVAQVSMAIGSAISVGQVAKLALRYDLNNSNLAAAGSLGTLDTSCSLPAAPTTVQFATDVSSQPLFGYLRRAAIWPRALTDAELTAVTGG